ncbi:MULTISPECIES: capsule biosynthesis protein [Achromobacter]|uniref:capsule biosynthesis protein n=1 Tax=Achromobacter TaxID=222 RepID=UPI0027DFC11D|nr:MULTISPECIES: capsular biosynthesis protein [Achromobacter]MDQ6212201.1 capsular biosynthesis protein [Achromobacter insolitus]MEB3097109.1 capsular biosynthesis protein [Achromobacter sp. D10]
MTRHYLFLQGVCSPFFSELGLALKSIGHRVSKVNYTVGDRMYWRLGQAINYRGPMDALPSFYADQFERLGITDIVVFGDCRPVHQPAIALARSLNITVHVFEEGYFRPYWITLERGGVNGNSSLPSDPDWYRAHSRHTPHFNNGQPFQSAFWKRAVYDVGYNFWAGLNPILHRGVRSHVPYSPITEYLGYLHRGIRVKCYARQSRECEAQLIAQSTEHPFFLLPLQLANDAQIVHHSPFRDMAHAMEITLASFAQHAPPASRLAVKIHPLDPGLVDYRKILHKAAERLNIPERVMFLESGNLPALLGKTAGVVTVNSTVGSSAIVHGRPTITLGHAIYNMPGLAFQGGLDSFWVEAVKPDMTLFRGFRDVVIQKTQINGGFYCATGISLAVKGAVARMTKNA